MFQFKLTGNIHEDILTVREATKYMASLADELMKEGQAQNLKIDVYIHLMNLNSIMEKALNETKHMCWRERERMYGPLAHREDFFATEEGDF